MLRILIIFCPLLLQAQAWVKLPNFASTKRDDGVAVVIDSKAYVGTGVDPGSATIDFRVLDLISNQWSSIPAMPFTTERQYACGFKTDTCFFVTCGIGPTGALTSTYRYSILNQNWLAVAPKPNAGLMSAVCFQFNNKIILAGGKGNNDIINHEVWEYDIANNSWQQKNKLPFSPLWRAAYSTLNGFGYLIGGVDSVGRFSPRLYRYSPNTDQWTLIDSIPVARGLAYQAMQAVNNRLFIFGGFDSLNTYHNDAFIYDPPTAKWIPAPALPAAPRKGGMSFSFGQNFYYTCGILADGDRQTETWMTDVPTGISEILNEKHECSVFPNPIKDEFKITTTNFTIEKISIYSLQGALLKELQFDPNNASVSVSHLETGLYILKIENKTGEFFYKNIKVD